jgi:hypothetical protein
MKMMVAMAVGHFCGSIGLGLVSIVSASPIGFTDFFECFGVKEDSTENLSSNH